MIYLFHASVCELFVGKLPAPPFIGPLPGMTQLNSTQHAMLAAHCILPRGLGIK